MYCARAFTRFGKLTIGALNLGYNYGLVAATRRDWTVSIVKGAGFFSGGMLIGFYFRTMCRHYLHEAVERHGPLPVIGLLASVVALDPRVDPGS
jgi:hypothetical protein